MNQSRTTVAPWPWAGVAALAVLLAGYLRAGFLLDDYLHLDHLLHAAGWHRFDYTIASDATGVHLWWLPHGVQIRFFRPLVMLALELQRAVFGSHPAAFHATSDCLHLVNVALCAALGRRLGLTRAMAWLAAIAWGVSVHAAVVVGWISGQSELLLAMCVLMSVIAFLRGAESGRARWFVASVVAFALALLAKEAAIVTPVLILAVRHATRTARRIPRGYSAAMGVLAVAYAVVRWRLRLPAPPEPYFQPVRTLADVGLVAEKILHYVGGAAAGLPVFPLGLGACPPRAAMAGAAILAGASGCVAFAWMAGRWRTGLIWFGCALAPYLVVMPTSLYLYLPLCGLYWTIARAVQRRHAPARVLLGWLLVSGVAAHAVAGVHLTRLSHSMEAATTTLARVAGTDCPDVVLVDAPFWSYALPSAVRLSDPACDVRLHVINIAPEGRGRPTQVTWNAPDAFRATAAGAGWFGSRVAQFFLFGASPCAGDAANDAGGVTVSCGGDDLLNPRVLDVSLGDSARCRPIVFQCDGQSLHELRP